MPRGRPGKSELEVLKVLWDLGRGTVREVHGVLTGSGREWAYTTVLTLLRRLAAKGLVESEKGGLAHVFRPAVSREDLLGRRLEDLSDELCDGQAAPLVRALIDRRGLERRDVEELRALLDELEASGPADAPGDRARGKETR